MSVHVRKPIGSPQKPVEDITANEHIPLEKVRSMGHDGIFYRNSVEDPDSVSLLYLGSEYKVGTPKRHELTPERPSIPWNPGVHVWKGGMSFQPNREHYREHWDLLPDKIYHVAPSSARQEISENGLNAEGRTHNLALSEHDIEAGGTWEKGYYKGPGSDTFHYRPEAVYTFADGHEAADQVKRWSAPQEHGRGRGEPHDIWEIDVKSLKRMQKHPDHKTDLIRDPELFQGNWESEDPEDRTHGDAEDYWESLMRDSESYVEHTGEYRKSDERQWALERVHPDHLKRVKPYEVKNPEHWDDDDIEDHLDDHPEEYQDDEDEDDAPRTSRTAIGTEEGEMGTKTGHWAEIEKRATRIHSNRVQQHINQVQDAIAGKGPKGVISQDDLDSAEQNLAITPSEHHAFQNAQAEAFTTGTLTEEEAMQVHRALGGSHNPSNGGWHSSADLATKTTVTTLMGQLVGQQIKRRRRGSLDLPEPWLVIEGMIATAGGPGSRRALAALCVCGHAGEEHGAGNDHCWCGCGRFRPAQTASRLSGELTQEHARDFAEGLRDYPYPDPAEHQRVVDDYVRTLSGVEGFDEGTFRQTAEVGTCECGHSTHPSDKCPSCGHAKTAALPHTETEWTGPIPDCEFCGEKGVERKATVDGRTKWGPWAAMCDEHHAEHGRGLGEGFGQRLLPKPEQLSLESKIAAPVDVEEMNKALKQVRPVEERATGVGDDPFAGTGIPQNLAGMCKRCGQQLQTGEAVGEFCTSFCAQQFYSAKLTRQGPLTARNWTLQGDEISPPESLERIGGEVVGPIQVVSDPEPSGLPFAMTARESLSAWQRERVAAGDDCPWCEFNDRAPEERGRLQATGRKEEDQDVLECSRCAIRLRNTGTSGFVETGAWDRIGDVPYPVLPEYAQDLEGAEIGPLFLG